jgi:[ribosomal protein S18]-alanine N-acetyltransferase
MTPIAVTFSWMVKRDLPSVLQIERECFPEPWTENDFFEHLRVRNIIGLVAKNEFGRTIGYMVYEVMNSRILILNLAVDRICQRRSVGTQLINKLKQKLNERRSGIRVNVIDTNLGAHLFFKVNSFRAVRVEWNHFEMSDGTRRDAYTMACKTPPLWPSAAIEAEAETAGEPRR